MKGSKELMHLKSYVIDRQLVRTGSANWSPTGLKRQDNDIRYEFSPAAAVLFEMQFGALWERPTNLMLEN